MNFFKTILAIALWFTVWSASQALFMSADQYSGTLHLAESLFQNTTLSFQFGALSLWSILLAAIAIVIWKYTVNDFSFLKPLNKKILLLYLIPVSFALYQLTKTSVFGVDSTVWVFGIIGTTFLLQDFLTFGLLQTYVSKKIGPFYALFVVGAVFFIAHMSFDMSVNTLLLLLGSFSFAYARYKTSSIYLGNVIHLSALLAPI